MSAKPKRSNVPPKSDFWGPPKTAEQLAAEQGVKPITDWAEFYADADPSITDEEMDRWLADLKAMRAEGTPREPRP